MVPTRERFEEFIALEKTVMSSIPTFHPWYNDVVEKYETHGTSHHDFKVHLKNGKMVLFQIQITDYGNKKSGYCRYHDVRLDLISSFDPFTEEGRAKYHDFSWRWKTLKNVNELEDFDKLCKVSKWGKLKTCDAEIFIFCVAKMSGRGTNKKIEKIHLINIFDNEKLKENCDYFVNTYGVKINHKQKEPWGSAFVPVDESDLVLNSCSINDKDTFLQCVGRKTCP